MGNRGRLHEGRGSRDIVRNHQNKTWITCALEFKGRRRSQWEPNSCTLLFFLDEATAFAAGHRPCAECRHSAYSRFRALWRQTHYCTTTSARDIDAQLHRERTNTLSHGADWPRIPDGAFVETDAGPAIVVGDHLAVWDRQTNTYGIRLARPTRGSATLITPPSLVAVLSAGYLVQIDESAR